MALFDPVGKTASVTHLSFDVSATAELVAATTGKKIRVLAMTVQADAGTTAFRSGDSTIKLGPVTATLTNGPPLVLPFNPAGWFETAAGDELNIVLSATDQNVGCLVYQLL